jgi:hypothetical protein
MIITKMGTINFKVSKQGDNWVVFNGDGEMIGEYSTEEKAREFARSEESKVEVIINNNI